MISTVLDKRLTASLCNLVSNRTVAAEKVAALAFPRRTGKGSTVSDWGNVNTDDPRTLVALVGLIEAMTNA